MAEYYPNPPENVNILNYKYMHTKRGRILLLHEILSHVPFIFEDKGPGGVFFSSDFSTSLLNSFVIESPRPRGILGKQSLL